MKHKLIIATFAASLFICGCAITKPNWLDRTLYSVSTNDAGQITLADRPAVTTGLEIGKALPIPYVGIGAGALAAALAVYRDIRNRNISRALVTGIEAGRELIKAVNPKLDQQFVETLTAHQDAAGVTGAVDKIVQAVTK